MADRRGLKFLGFIFATVTLAVMLATGMVVKGYADGAYSLEGDAVAVDESDFANHSAKSSRLRSCANFAIGPRRKISAAPDQRQRQHRGHQQPDKADHDGAHPCGGLRIGMGSLLSGRMLFMQVSPEICRRRRRLLLVAAWTREFKGACDAFAARNRITPDQVRALRLKRSHKTARPLRSAAESPGIGRSAVAKAVRGALPLRDIVGDHPGRFHRGLAELGIAGDFALDALTFGVQQVAQAFQFGNQIFDFRQRRSGDALDQRVDVVDGGLGARLQRGVGAARRMPGAGRRR